jgi:hypothetical protein
MPVTGNNKWHSPENADRIAIFLASLEGDGSERIALNPAQGFAERGLEVDLVLQSAKGPYLDQVPDGVRIVDLRAGRMARAAFPLISYLRRERPPFLLSLMTGANIIAITSGKLAREDTRLVISEHLTIPLLLQTFREGQGACCPSLVSAWRTAGYIRGRAFDRTEGFPHFAPCLRSGA